MSKPRLLLKSIEWLVFIALLAIAVVAASPLLPTKSLASFYVVVSGSMEPTIPTGSLILTKGVEAEDLRSGDIIAFTSPTDANKTITHRIESVTNNGQSFTTKGDNNDAADAWVVSAENVKGKFVYGLPYVGYAIEWARSPIGFAVVIGIPALLFIFFQIKKIREGINEEVEKRSQKALAEQLTSSNPATANNVESPPADNSEEKNSNNTSGIRRVGPTTFAILLAAGMLLSSVTAAQAYFSSKVAITGITLKAAGPSSEHTCHNYERWEELFGKPPFLGVKPWEDSWLDALFDWQEFWTSLGMDVPNSCGIPVAPSPFSNNHKPTATPTPIPTPTPTPTPTSSSTPSPTPTPAPTATPTPTTTPQSTTSATTE